MNGIASVAILLLFQLISCQQIIIKTPYDAKTALADAAELRPGIAPANFYQWSEDPLDPENHFHDLDNSHQTVISTLFKDGLISLKLLNFWYANKVIGENAFVNATQGIQGNVHFACQKMGSYCPETIKEVLSSRNGTALVSNDVLEDHLGAYTKLFVEIKVYSDKIMNDVQVEQHEQLIDMIDLYSHNILNEAYRRGIPLATLTAWLDEQNAAANATAPNS